MLNYSSLLRSMQQIRAALRSGSREALAPEMEALDAMVGPQTALDIYGRLLLEETAAPLPRRGPQRPATPSHPPEVWGD